MRSNRTFHLASIAGKLNFPDNYIGLFDKTNILFYFFHLSLSCQKKMKTMFKLKAWRWLVALVLVKIESKEGKRKGAIKEVCQQLKDWLSWSLWLHGYDPVTPAELSNYNWTTTGHLTRRKSGDLWQEPLRKFKPSENLLCPTNTFSCF
jgi:hypothetical protein